MKLPTLQEQIIIEEILTDANIHDLREEVRNAAEEIWQERKEEEEFTLLEAYHIAFNDLVK
jgi:hypothetical protein